MTPFAPITLDRDAEVPLGIQLAWALRSRITSGQIPSGARLPGARELAEDAGVNVNTVRAVFARLEDEGLLTVVHGRGTFVADDPPPAAAVAELAAEVTSEARRRGIDPRAVAAALYVEPAGAAVPDRAGREPSRRTLREQIARLERRLAELPVVPPAGDAAAVPPPRPSQAGRLLSTADLELQRDRLAAQVADAERRSRAERADPAAAPEPAATPERAPTEERSSVTRVRGRAATLRWVPGG